MRKAILAKIEPRASANCRSALAIEARRPVMEAYAQWLMGKDEAKVVPFPSAGVTKGNRRAS